METPWALEVHTWIHLQTIQPEFQKYMAASPQFSRKFVESYLGGTEARSDGISTKPEGSQDREPIQPIHCPPALNAIPAESDCLERDEGLRSHVVHIDDFVMVQQKSGQNGKRWEAHHLEKRCQVGVGWGYIRNGIGITRDVKRTKCTSSVKRTR